jgi:two-component system response regulator HydG
MNRNVLIIDDDEDFSQLLKDIYEQADYTVFTAVNSDGALNVIQNNPVNLVVTDQRLPGSLSGTDIIQKVRDMGFSVPIIMVSGFLDDDAIRDLIRDGVEGVFIKPLNVFSLLKKSSELLEARAKSGKGSDTAGDGETISSGTPGTVGHIEGLSEKGAAFLKRARQAASFKRNLLLIGPSGTLFEEVSRDLVALSGQAERCQALKPGQVTEDGLHKLFEGDLMEQPLTLVLLEAEQLSEDEVDSLIAFGDEFGGSASALRMIFCLRESVESLYDQGKVDEELYLFLGSNELIVPALKDIPEDLIQIARREILERSREVTFDIKLRSLLLEYDWPENMVELRAVIVRAATLAQPMPPTVRHFEAAMNPDVTISQSTDGMRSSLERFLTHERTRYLEARNILKSS